MDTTCGAMHGRGKSPLHRAVVDGHTDRIHSHIGTPAVNDYGAMGWDGWVSIVNNTNICNRNTTPRAC